MVTLNMKICLLASVLFGGLASAAGGWSGSTDVSPGSEEYDLFASWQGMIESELNEEYERFVPVSYKD